MEITRATDPSGLADTATPDGAPASATPVADHRMEKAPAPGQDDEDLSGLHLDHFEVLQRLGQGGMGTVCEARDESLDRRVALKLLRRDLTHEPKQEARFLREARAQAKLNNPHVVHIYHIGRRPPGPHGHTSLYFAMELVEGESLGALLDRGERLESEEAREMMIQVAEGLRAACRAGIIHRDIKPSNLLIHGEGGLKIADFGLALPIEGGDDPRITQQGAMVGTPLYMAPEQARGHELDHRADMYAIGATFYHLLAGRPPFEGPSGLAIIAQHLSERPPSLRASAPHVALPVARIIDRLLAKDPAQRYDTYDALIAALEHAAPGRREYAGFWTRGAAVLIDSILATALIWALGWLGLVVHVAFVTLGQAYRGETIAKHFLRIRVHRKDGARLGLLRSAARTVLSVWAPIVAGGLIFWYQGASELGRTIEQLNPQQLAQLQSLLVAIGISNGFLTLLWSAGLVMAAFHPKKRAIHDLAVGSVVTYRFSDR